MKREYPELSELMIRAMKPPEEVNIRRFELIPFTGKLSKLTGMKHMPFKTISIKDGNKQKKIQVFFNRTNKKAYVQEILVERYKKQLEVYFLNKQNMLSDGENKSISEEAKNKNKEIIFGKSQSNFDINEEKAITDNHFKTKNAKDTNITELSSKELKKYLISDFGDHTYKRSSIIEIYSYDIAYFNSLKSAGRIRQEALKFFDERAVLLEEANLIPTSAFRKLKFEQIVDDYINKPVILVKNTKSELITKSEQEKAIVDNLWNSLKPNSQKTPEILHDNRIRVKDFLIRSTTFKCMNRGHSIRNIEGIIDVIDDRGVVSKINIPAGYCPKCNVFFILESTFQHIKAKGTPICRISDEKSYLKSFTNVKGMKLAQESILMQYGYTVSQQEGLSQNRRRKILNTLIDNSVLTKTDIISYLDFFINQHKHQHKYELAVKKWEKDREYVSHYKLGQYTEFKVGSISRKKK